MKVGIVEICEPNHYTAVSALAKTYLFNPSNEVVLFTTESIKPLFDDLAGSVTIITLCNSQEIEKFLREIASYGLDRIHINTISKYYSEFARVDWPANVVFTAHNIDLWYENTFSKRFITLSSDIRALPSNAKTSLILFVKDIWRQRYRDCFIKNISKKDYRILVYSQSQKKHLEKYVNSQKILVFPFCLHTAYTDLSDDRGKLRFCIPGSVDTQRRNYAELFQILRSQLSTIKKDIAIDLLGYIPKDQRFVIEEIESLKSDGFEIIYNEGFIEASEFDRRLALSDMILGNLKIQVNVFRKYGETKETGVTFNIIKSGKPGFLPDGYPVDEALKDACVYFKDYSDLADQIKILNMNRENLRSLKAKAKEVAAYFEPKNLYSLLEVN
jgi:hypothetical protein